MIEILTWITLTLALPFVVSLVFQNTKPLQDCIKIFPPICALAMDPDFNV